MDLHTMFPSVIVLRISQNFGPVDNSGFAPETASIPDHVFVLRIWFIAKPIRSN
jgi:hypothetical protein